MDSKVDTAHTSTLTNGKPAASSQEAEELYTQLLHLRDAVILGQHPHYRLPTSVIEQLKASAVVTGASNASTDKSHTSALGSTSSSTANGTQLSQPPSFRGSADNSSTKPSASSYLDPIFLEKPEILVKAESRLKRQRTERDLRDQVEQRKLLLQNRDLGIDAPSVADIDMLLHEALDNVHPISGLKPVALPRAVRSSSFDENDYYSSQVQSDWSSEASPGQSSKKAVGTSTADFEHRDVGPSVPKSYGALTNDFERLDGAPTLLARDRRENPTLPRLSSPFSSKQRPHTFVDEEEDHVELGDEDDDYTPPDAAAIDSSRQHLSAMDGEDDNSEYEPGEITQDSNYPTPDQFAEEVAQTAATFPVIRNNVTHIAAPQPSRVSPLATAKGPSIELELVNGRPEVVQRHQTYQSFQQSRVSTVSPPANGGRGNSRKARNKKRKRDQELTGRKKRRRERLAADESPAEQEIPIKNEPVSPPPFAPEAPQYAAIPRYQPVEIDLRSPGHIPRHHEGADYPRPRSRYEYAQVIAPTFGSSPAGYRPIPRDTENLRRVVSLHNAQRPASPQQLGYSPNGPYRAASATYRDPRATLPPAIEASDASKYYEQTRGPTQYPQLARARSPAPLPSYGAAYPGRASSPTLMPPPERIIVDQYGNRYFATEASSTSATQSRASVAALDRQSGQEAANGRAPSRASVPYPQPSQQSSYYDRADGRVATQPPANIRPLPPEQRVEYLDANRYRISEYTFRRPESPRYDEPIRSWNSPAVPAHGDMPAYRPMPPPLAPPRRAPASPVYESVSRSYSVRPEEPYFAQSGYARQASVAPTPYLRQDTSAHVSRARAASAMPGSEYRDLVQHPQPLQAYAPPSQTVRYVDQYGNEVFPTQVRQVYQ